MKDNRMDNIVECAYNMDNGYVEVWFTDGNMLRIKCEEVEAALSVIQQIKNGFDSYFILGYLRDTFFRRSFYFMSFGQIIY